jgi:hypothetical protein
MARTRVEKRTAPGTIGARLQSARSSRFVGRRAELELFERALDEPATAFSVLFVHGPPGVGKSALVREFAGLAADRGRRVAVLDLRQVETTPAAVSDELDVDVDVVVLDTYEVASALDGWIRDHLVPALPEGALVVIAGRLPPSPDWSADPGWRPLLRVIALRNLRPDDAEQLLAAEGIHAAWARRVVDETFGHPLALCLYLDLIAQRGDRDADAVGALLEEPDVVRALLDRFADEVPSPSHRAALEVCAHVRFTTEELLRVAADGTRAEAAELFDWLRGLSFVDATPKGLLPHDLARELLDNDLRWRDEAAYDALHRRVRAHFIEQVRSKSARDRHRAAADLVFLHRSNLLMRPFWDLTGLSQGYVDRLRPDDPAALREMVGRHEGPESVKVLDHWLARQPDGFAVFRLGADLEPRGFTALIALHDATADDLIADPGAGAMWRYAQQHAPTSADGAVVVCRFIVDRDAHQTPGTLSFSLSAANHLQHMLANVDRAMDFIGGIAVPEQLEPLFTYIDFLAAPAAYDLDGRTWTVFARNWRNLGVDAWFETMADRELGAPVTSPPSSTATTIALSQPDFADAVRAALRDLHRPEKLRHNPLLRSRLLGDSARPDTLASVVTDTIGELGDDPRHEKFHRALDRTFLRPAPTQERAAEVLDLPFSTYRRHLTRGIELVTAALWDRELYGAVSGK